MLNVHWQKISLISSINHCLLSLHCIIPVLVLEVTSVNRFYFNGYRVFWGNFIFSGAFIICQITSQVCEVDFKASLHVALLQALFVPETLSFKSKISLFLTYASSPAPKHPLSLLLVSWRFDCKRQAYSTNNQYLSFIKFKRFSRIAIQLLGFFYSSNKIVGRGSYWSITESNKKYQCFNIIFTRCQ